MESVQIAVSGGIIMALIGWFLKNLHGNITNSIRELREEKNELHDKVVKLEGRVERIEEKIPSELKNLEKIMDLKFEELTRTIRHAERTIKAQSDAFVTLFQEHTKEDKK